MKIRRPELTLAPLIDCVFLLLLFFALATTLAKEQGMPIEKPMAKAGIPLSKEYFIITITKDEEVFLGREKATLDRVRGEIIKELALYPKLSVIITSDKAVSCGRLVEILDLCKECGIKDLSLATIPKLK
ncbi:TPA: hypothetical protein DCX15_03030 [bacterium]|nr:hypothetical protein [bacterium]